ncbi:hypothetical protein BVY03_02275 [bacterium K02(2017)]|nr:hypothetical protein BVY03_02275 [bacterium K02(2017)]
MMSVKLKIITIAITLIFSTPVMAVVPDNGTKAQQDSGKKIYDNLCSQCHGDQGVGDGIAQKYLKPWPRNFKKGIYKFKSTPDDRLPTNKDLIRVIRKGNPYTGMPAWPQLTDEEVLNVVYYLKTFTKEYADAESMKDESIAPIPLKLPSSAPSWNQESADKGKKLFAENKCIDCHGKVGRGSGTSAPTTEDIDSNQIRPRDLTKRWTFRNGPTRDDIFRTISMGISPMPSFHNLSEQERWNIVDYVYSLGESDEAKYDTVVLGEPIQGDLDLSKSNELFKNAKAAYFPVIAQVIQPGRAFYASADGVEVKAIYNKDEIAIMLSWHDMAAEINKPTETADAGGDDDGWGDDSGDDWGDDSGGDDWGDDSAESNEPVVQKNAPDIKIGIIDPKTTKEKHAGYSDAVAIQIPSKKVKGVIKPYFVFGDKKMAVDLWFADLANAKDKADFYTAKSAANITKGDELINFKSSYVEGRWETIFKRKRIKENGTSFEEKGFTPIAFSIWDGFNNERGNKRGLTSWFHVYLKPMKEESILGKMALGALFAVLIELAIVGLVRRKKK